jgi:roadblock/LC7 domain-containing protein
MATMAKENWKYITATALTGGEALKYSAKGVCELATSLTDKPVGIAAEACAAASATAPVNISVWVPYGEATVQVLAGAAITAGDYLTVTTGGEFITTTPKATYEASAVEWIWCYANEAAGAIHEVIEMVWCLTSQSQ